MASRVMLVGAGMVLGVVLGAAAGIHADDPSRDVKDVAAAAGYDPVELAGAVASVGTDPYTYARWEGKLAPLKPPPIADKWLRLVQCEASGNWQSASNPIYKGGPQFDSATWARHGGLEFAWRADFATPAQQVIVAERTLKAQGPGAWPVCGPRTGLR